MKKFDHSAKQSPHPRWGHPTGKNTPVICLEEYKLHGNATVIWVDSHEKCQDLKMLLLKYRFFFLQRSWQAHKKIYYFQDMEFLK